MARKKRSRLVGWRFSLKREEFGRIYGCFPGTRSMASPDSIRAKKQIQWIHVRHEETAAFCRWRRESSSHGTGWLYAPGKLRSWEPTFDQWVVRLSTVAVFPCWLSRHTFRAMKSGADIFKETKPRTPLRASGSHYCELVSQPEADAPAFLEIAIGKRRLAAAVVVCRGCSAAWRRRGVCATQ